MQVLYCIHPCPRSINTKVSAQAERGRALPSGRSDLKARCLWKCGMSRTVPDLCATKQTQWQSGLKGNFLEREIHGTSTYRNEQNELRTRGANAWWNQVVGSNSNSSSWRMNIQREAQLGELNARGVIHYPGRVSTPLQSSFPLDVRLLKPARVGGLVGGIQVRTDSREYMKSARPCVMENIIFTVLKEKSWRRSSRQVRPEISLDDVTVGIRLIVS